MSTKITETVITPWDSIFSSKKKGASDNKEVKVEYGIEETESSTTPVPVADPPTEPAPGSTKKHYLALSIR